MKPLYFDKYINKTLFDTLLNEVAWVNRDAPRDECFMTLEPMEYTYGKGFTRTYKSIDMHKEVESIMAKLNEEFEAKYDVCFLNYYKSEREQLGWHADDSPEMDPNHPIAVISFGAERDIWTKKNGFMGVIPEEDRYKLGNGSLFVMPAGFQADNLHRIPKNDRPCGGRISLTYRKIVKI